MTRADRRAQIRQVHLQRIAQGRIWYQRAQRRRLLSQRVGARVTFDLKVDVSGLLDGLSEAGRTLDHQVDAMRYALDGLRLTR